MRSILFSFAFVGFLVVVLIFFFLGYFSLPVFEHGGFLATLLSSWNPDTSYGLLPMIVGSLSIAVLSTILSFVYSVCVALTINGLKKSQTKEMFIMFFALLSSIPTVVYGFIGVIVLVPFVRDLIGGSGFNILSASFVLSFVITPTMVLFFIDSFENTPTSYKLITKSLGGTTINYQLKVLLPYHIKSILVALAMGFSRAIGDTMIALMIAGNSTLAPTAITDSARTLTSHIMILFAGDFDSLEFKSIFASGFILFLLSIFMLLFIRFLRRI